MSIRTSNPNFPETRWSLIRDSRGDDTLSREALEEFCRAYWFPVYGFARGLGMKPEEAEDATQVLFEKVVGKKGVLDRVSPEAGKLRSYLMVSLRNEMAQEARRAMRLKRGGGAQVLSIDSGAAEGLYLADAVDNENPERGFERRWATAVLDAALARVRSDYEARGEGDLFAALAPLLTDIEHGKSFKSSAERLGKSEGAVRVAVFRMRKRYRRAVREEIAETVSDRSQVEEEIEALFHALRP